MGCPSLHCNNWESHCWRRARLQSPAHPRLLAINSEASPEQLTSLQTKNTPVHCVRFAATNYVAAAGVYLPRPDDH